MVLEDAVERSEYTAIVRDKLLRCPMLVVCSRNQDATTNAQIGLAQKYNRIVTTLDGLKKAVSEGDDLVSRMALGGVFGKHSVWRSKRTCGVLPKPPQGADAVM